MDPRSQRALKLGVRENASLTSVQARAHRPHVEARLMAVAQPAVLRAGGHEREHLELVLAAARLLEDLELQHAVVSK